MTFKAINKDSACLAIGFFEARGTRHLVIKVLVVWDIRAGMRFSNIENGVADTIDLAIKRFHDGATTLEQWTSDAAHFKYEKFTFKLEQ